MSGLRVVPVALLITDKDTEVVLKDDKKVPHSMNFEVRKKLSFTINAEFLCDNLLKMMQKMVIKGAHSCWISVGGAVISSVEECIDLVGLDPSVVILEVKLTIPGHTAALLDRLCQADDGVSLNDAADHLMSQTPQATALVGGQAPQMILELDVSAYVGKDGMFSQHAQDINDESLDDKLHSSSHGLLTVIMILDEMGV